MGSLQRIHAGREEAGDAGEQATARWRSFEDVRRELNVSPKTLRRALIAGEIRGFKVGQQWRIPADALEQALRGERS